MTAKSDLARSYHSVPRGEFGFINLLRGPAALLVVYSHYMGQYLDWIHQTLLGKTLGGYLARSAARHR